MHFRRSGWALLLALAAAAALFAQSPPRRTAAPGQSPPPQSTPPPNSAEAQGTQPQATPPLTLRIIVVGTSEEAASVLDRLKRGDSFAALARSESIDPSAGDGGFLGRLDPAALRPDVRAALQGLQRGEVSRVEIGRASCRERV